MEFTRDALLGDESRMLASSVRDFRAAEIDDAARELDEDPESGLAESLFRTAESLGLADALLSEKAGGQGMDAMSFCLALEEVAAGSAGFASLLLSHDLALWALNLAGAAEGAEGPTEGERLALAFPSVEEAGALLSEFVSGLTGAAACVVVNPSSGEVYAVLTGSEFADVMDIPEPLGLRAARPAGIRIRAGEVVPAGCLSEEELRQLEALLLLGIGALAVGLTRRALEKAHSYARERYQGGDLIINHEQMRLMLADMAVGIETCASALARAASPGTALNLPACRAVKIAACDLAMRSTTDGVQIHGGYGYMRDYGMEVLMRDAKYCQAYPRSPQLERLKLMEELGHVRAGGPKQPGRCPVTG
jgi:alkylation response protein AidB-like acyl-CoA dehydrogenase